jgi:hypothetical protein
LERHLKKVLQIAFLLYLTLYLVLVAVGVAAGFFGPTYEILFILAALPWDFIWEPHAVSHAASMQYLYFCIVLNAALFAIITFYLFRKQS